LRHSKIAVIGGSGLEGKSIAKGLATAGHQIFIGSREKSKAKSVVTRIMKNAKTAIPVNHLQGCTNKEAVKKAEVVFLAIPYDALRETLDKIGGEMNNKLIVDVIVPYKLRSPMILDAKLMKQYRGHFGPAKSPSVTEEIFLYLQGKYKYRPRLVAGLKTVSFKSVVNPKGRAQPILTWGYDSGDMQILTNILRKAISRAEIMEVPQMYWRSVEGVCELIRFMCLQGSKIEAMNFSYGAENEK